jgi:ABC-type sulfate transport system permease subunit
MSKVKNYKVNNFNSLDLAYLSTVAYIPLTLLFTLVDLWILARNDFQGGLFEVLKVVLLAPFLALCFNYIIAFITSVIMNWALRSSGGVTLGYQTMINKKQGI